MEILCLSQLLFISQAKPNQSNENNANKTLGGRKKWIEAANRIILLA
ncbi:uncharacterized protein Dyak_GE28372 [Drosophila yakuba]|uniref:Uncharacterized protein n=1 Tax=Drosophila yakuba TaxID=7245 RepID=A0A0R1DPR8_DROYA|nr:uncharacterized protein Dyak_GE28372 [Drosophila yakuba]